MPSVDLLHSLLSNLWSIFLVVAFFGGSIFVHELGHFLAARRRGVLVERFSIGFGPPIFSWRGKDGVKYQVAWFPLGGYVLLPQLADLGAIEGERETTTRGSPAGEEAAGSAVPATPISAAMAIDAAPEGEISYASKIIVFAAGATFNILFAFALACVIWVIGQPEPNDAGTTRIGYVSKTIDLPNGSKIPSPASEAGLRPGDIVREIDGRSVTNWTQLMQTLVTGTGRGADGNPLSTFKVERDGVNRLVELHPRVSGDDQMRRVGIAPGYDLMVYQVTANTAMARAGLKAGDQILQFNGLPEINISAFSEDLATAPKKSGVLVIKRDGRELSLTVPPRDGLHENAGIEFIIGIHLVHPSPFAQIGDLIVMTFRTLWGLISPHSDIGLSKMAGPVGIVHIFHDAAEAGLRSVLMFTILVNVNLAIFNLLPIPVLDGGHMLFATIGRLRGRVLPVNFIMTTQSVFIVLLLSVMVYLTVFDVQRWKRDAQAERADALQAAKP